ncbi:MAG: hypothetical protein IKE00_00575 [Oscillospiraceae bacterium]|nr:hypothetical protein [Oscillospiraceae bacterium]
MMIWKQGKSFFEESIVFLFIVTVLAFAFANRVIVIRWTIQSVLLFALLTIWLTKYIFSFLRLSLYLAIDGLFHQIITINAAFVEQFPLKTSPFLEKSFRTQQLELDGGIHRFKLVIKPNHEKESLLILISAKYYQLKPGETYTFVYGKHSKVLLGIS